MASLNKTFLIGNLTSAPELRHVPSGQAVCNMRMATNRKFKAGNGETREEVTYVGVEVWGKSAEACAHYLTKGSPAFIEGRLKFKEWTAQDGTKRSMLLVQAERVQFLHRSPQGAQAAHTDEAPPSDMPPPPSDDDIPF